ncbi:MAG: hypothetical protein CM1200mP39_15080 [Dehalococcoidia bacterium]|nr:MAG: hypothetical protein CM1200mP39_15080 [Dehalococcoidia bacterium]
MGRDHTYVPITTGKSWLPYRLHLQSWSPGVAVNAPYGGARTRYESAGIRFNSFSEEVTKRPAEQTIEDAKKELLDETGTNFDSFLETRSNGQPFCYWWGPTNTHRTWEQGSGKDLGG